jgi:hypothetical protein
MMARFEIDNIAPFNESSFNNCTYPIRFSVLRRYGRPITPLILGEYHRFGCAHDPGFGRTMLHFETHFLRDPDDVLTSTLGIRQLKKEKCENVLADLEQAIAARRPVMLSIDRFHEPFVAQFFQRRHHLHSVLVYAYDDGARTFGLFEDNCDNRGDEIVACSARYDDVARAYASCHERWRDELSGVSTFVAFSADEPPADLAAASTAARAQFVASVVQQEDSIRRGLDDLRTFVERFAAEARHPASADVPDLYHAMFRRIVELKATNQYQTRHVLDDASELTAKGDALVKAWNRIRVRALRAAVGFQPAILAPFVEDVTAKLRAALELELNHHDLYFEAMRRAASAPPALQQV